MCRDIESDGITHLEHRHSLVCPSALQLTAMAMLSLPSPTSKLTPFTLHTTMVAHYEGMLATPTA